MFRISIIIFCFSLSILGQTSAPITIIGDSLVGKTINGEIIREVYGNVILTQNDITITCDKAIQFITRNNAELIGNVVAKKQNTTITTPRGFYYGNSKTAQSNSGIKLDDKKVILTAQEGEYLFSEDIAYFKNNVRLYDTVTTLTSNELTYYRNNNLMLAYGKVHVVDKSNIIDADTLEFLRDKRITFANSNVKLFNHENNFSIWGQHLEDYANTFYSVIDDNPLLIKIDTIYTSRIDTITNDTVKTIMLDTLIMKADIVESFRDTINQYIATGNVEVIKGDFASRNSKTIYKRNNNLIYTYKEKKEQPQPIIWSGNSQLTGDSVKIVIENDEIKLLDVFRKSFVLSFNPLFINRYDQIAGDSISMQFENSRLIKTNVFGSVFSIYYLYEGPEPNGLIKSTSNTAKINFQDQKVIEVKLFGSPVSEYHPEPVVTGKEPSFTLPQFVMHKEKPVKEKIFQSFFTAERKHYGSPNIKK